MFASFMKSNSQTKSSEDAESFVHVMEIDGVNEAALTFTVTPKHDKIGIQSDQVDTQFCATIKARNLPEEDDSARAPVDIVVALDVSSSMSGTKLKLCKETLTLLLRELSARDRFGLVTFGSEATIQIPTKKLTKENKENIVAKIKTLHTSGCTNMSGGIGLAAQELKSIECPNKVQTIFLLTDGHANMGISDRDGIVKLTKGCLGSDDGLCTISIHCFGYGTDHDKNMLCDISEATEGGTYYFVENDTNVSSAFGDALGGILSVVAQNTVLTFQAFNENNASIINILHDKAVKQENGSFKVSIGDFYAEESRDIILNVSLANGSGFGSEPVSHISVSMTYMDTINKKLVNCEAVKGSIVRMNRSEVSEVNKHVALQYARVTTTEMIEEAENLANSGNYVAAKSKIKSQIDYLNNESTTFDQSNPLLSQLLNELNTILSGLSSKSSWESGGAYYTKTRCQTHKMQRCGEASVSAMNMNAYVSSAKRSKAMKMSFAGSKK